MSSKTCPYKDRVSGNIIIANNDFCPSRGKQCVITPDCTVVSDMYSFKYVGDFSDLSRSMDDVTLLSSITDTIDLTFAKLPDTITSLTFSSFKIFKEPPVTFHWPENLYKITYEYNNAQTFAPIIPRSVQSLAIRADTIDQPRRIPPNAKRLQLNARKTISKIDATGVTRLYIGRVGKCSISHLKVNSSLELIYFKNDGITGWVMDAETFDVVNQLKPQGNYSNSELAEMKGFFFDIPTSGPPFSITTSKEECDRSGGQLQELQQFRQVSHGPFREGVKATFIVCVLPPGSRIDFDEAESSSLSTGAIVGIVLGGVAILIAILYAIRRTLAKQRAKNVADDEPSTTTASAHVSSTTP
ncbi:Aste57867_21013 [Aphanomyces stellatus]|uniref:Aste57867_21013 protein n=1 Tax=Aphanomyces stellatus TaxID=120398 RepID=A0A485LGE9_9STRA|nr:hypothetical protein As57867_020945 [Aphanomyces stellatus]VFT97688.1 Aste57867_21013 [Aphanomyces stellatus]